jgi:2-octaprenyl-6-methoxyphenol hydroxylase
MEDTPDILVAGAGLAGLAASLAMAQSGRRVFLAGPVDLRATTRTVALLDGSMRFFEALGLRSTIEAQGAPLRVMRIVDDTGSLFRGPPAEFDAGEIGLDAFGWNIGNDILLRLLADAVGKNPNIRHVDELTTGYDFAADAVTMHLAGGRKLRGNLLIACDGQRSLARESAQISAQTWSYPQTALTAMLSHTVCHDDVSTEFHTREGPCTFVPLPGRSGGRWHSSLVWVMHPREAKRRAALDPAALIREIERASHHILGAMTLERGPGFVPMEGLLARDFSGKRIALAGEAAHAFPPIGAQGLNLGLRDVAHLRDCVERYGTTDAGAPEVLAAFSRQRRADIGSRTFGVDMLNRSLLTPLLPVDFVRGMGLRLLANVRPLRRLAMREGIMPQGNVPSMMKQTAAQLKSL